MLERPVYVPAAETELFGVVTEPEAGNGVGVLVLPGGGGQLSLHRNRWNVRLCRELAGDGFRAMRIDFHGMGESGGFAPRLDLHDLFDEDVVTAGRWLQEQGAERLVLVGTCFGARSALLAASRLDDVAGLVLISPPVRDFRFGERAATRRTAPGMTLRKYARAALRWQVIRGLADPQLRRRYLDFAKRRLAVSWRRAQRARRPPTPDDESGTFLDPLRGAFRRRVPILLVYGEDEDYYAEFRRHLDELGPIFEDPASSVRLTTLPGVVHGFTDLPTQATVLDLVSTWVSRLVGAEADAGSRGNGSRLGANVPAKP